jgi:hypothetical protein
MRRWLTPAVLLCVSLGLALAQGKPQTRKFAASKADVEKALQELHAFAGSKLPTLEGFADFQQESPDNYQRGYYQYSLDVIAVSPTQTEVRVNAKITAWHKAGTPSQSGYAILTSNGRLESDLLENLADALGGSNTATAKPDSTATDNHSSVPNAPSSNRAQSSVFKAGANPLPRSTESATETRDSATEKRIQQLTAEGNSLREILRNQSRPFNLAVIKVARTPILEKPIDGSKLLLTADAEDEFQIVDTAGDWVHVQVSGLSRGWVRRSEVDIPAGSDQSLSMMENDPRTYDRPPSFQETREEVSVFPGKWEPLDGKKVKIIWVQPSGSKSFGSAHKLTVLKSVLHKSYPQVSSSTPPVAGIVIILDSEDGGMAAAPMAALQQWQAGHLADTAFWKRCLLDPAEAFKDSE